MSDYFELSEPLRRWVESFDGGLAFEEIATFDSKLLRAPRVLVPVDVQALVVAEGQSEERGDLAVRGMSPGSDLTEPQLPAPFAKAGPLLPGVHLHWALPDALTAAEPDEEQDLDLGLPPLPDRWVVSRISAPTRRGAKRSVVSWVLEADVGRAFALGEWRSDREETGRPGQPLTAVSGGDVAWAAVYENVVNRFAFHDPMDGLSAFRRRQPHTYVVMGWYQDATDDPIHPSRTPDGLAARVAALGWDVDLESDEAGAKGQAKEFDYAAAIGLRVRSRGSRRLDRSTPRQSLYHGTVFSVVNSKKAVVSNERRPSATVVQVAIGPTVPEAISRLASTGIRSRRLDNERLLSAFTHGVLDEFRFGNAVGVEEGVHRGSFRSEPGGSVTEFVRRQLAEVSDVRDPASRSAGTVGFGFSRRRGGLPAGDIGRIPSSVGISDAGVVSKSRPLPRYHLARDLSVGLKNLNRSLRHGYDGIFEVDEVVRCRLSGQAISEFADLVAGSDVIPAVNHGSVPAELNELLEEAALLEPALAEDLVSRVPSLTKLDGEPLLMIRAEQELTILTAAQQPAPQLFEASRREGTEPSQLGLTYWQQAWVPLTLEWSVKLGLSEQWRQAWSLGDVDYDLTGTPPPPDTTISGRSLLTSAGARLLADNLQQFIEGDSNANLTSSVSSNLASIASSLSLRDIMSTSLNEVTDRLQGYEESVVAVDIDEEHAEIVPTAPLELLRAGQFEFTRMRVVDCFGRVLDLSERLGRVGFAEELSPTPETDHVLRSPAPATRVGLLAPRLTVPARLMFRFRDASNPSIEARLDESRVRRVTPTTPRVNGSPVVGWIFPDHADDALEFFDANGSPLGQLFHRGHKREVVWEGVPGYATLSSTGPPSGIAGGDTLSRLVSALVRHDVVERVDASAVESPLAALLRVVDTTTWTTDPYGSTGLEHVSELIGRPIAVVSASLGLEVRNDVAEFDGQAAYTDAVRQARDDAFQSLKRLRFPVRLGSLDRFDDGLLAFFIDSNFSQLQPVHSAVKTNALKYGAHEGFLSDNRGLSSGVPARPVVSSYVGDQADIDLGAGSGERVRVTLLMLPGLGVTATTGLLPRKTLQLQRVWVNQALARISPSFRVGPVLVDPEKIRMPKSSALGPKQGWTRRDSPVTWRTDPITAATAEARLPERTFTVQEGWVTATPEDEDGGAS